MLLKKAFTPLIIAQLLLSPLFSHAAENAEISIPRVSGDINIDAQLDEPQWQQARKIDINIVTRPYDNTLSPVSTHALLMEDGGTFYIAFVAEDPEPEKIRTYYKDRDKSWGDDLVGIKIDAYNDQRSAYRFLANPYGVQIDGIENEVTKNESDSWDGIWDSAGKVNETGYIVEMALPLRMLSFEETTEEQKWGIELVRYYPREDFLRISNVRIERDNRCEICQLATISGFKGAKQGNNLTITPSLVAGKRETKDSDDNWESDENTEASLDIRWGITPDILLNATINPDFSTVETDSAQLNINNNFTLFFQEKRPFFLDNADYFESNYNLVYTRNISAPNYGAKLTGRQGDHALGLFYTDDKNTNILIPGNRTSSVGSIDGESQASVVRYRYSYDPNITLGWISTLRTATDYDNQVHGVDGRFKLSTFQEIDMQYLYSNTEYPSDFYEQFCGSDEENACTQPSQESCDLNGCDYNEKVLRTQKDDAFSGNAFKASYRYSDENWFYRASFNQQNSGFRGDLGFMSRVDHRRYAMNGNHKWYSQPHSWWSQYRVEARWNTIENDNNEFISESYELITQLNAINDSFFKITLMDRDKVGNRLDKRSLDIDGNTTRFNEQRISFFAKTKLWPNVEISSYLQFGDSIDFSNNRLGRMKQINPRLEWNVNEHLEIKIKQTYSQLDADSANVYIARLTDMRATYQFDVQSFIRFSLIYNNTTRNPNNYLYTNPEDISKHSKNLSTELLYAYKINPQTVFYLGYSDHHDGEENLSDLEQNERSVFMKFSYAWLR